MRLSYADDWNNNYKLAGLTIFRDLGLHITVRSPEQVTDVLAMIGGLDYFIYTFLFVAFGWTCRITARASYISRLYYDRISSQYKSQVLSEVEDFINNPTNQSNHTDKNKQKIKSAMISRLSNKVYTPAYKNLFYLIYSFFCNNKLYKSALQKQILSNAMLDKDLDMRRIMRMIN